MLKCGPIPWRIEGSLTGENRVRILDAEGFEVAEITPNFEEWHQEEIQNVHLLAAAPELYLQLKALATQIEASGRLIVPPNVIRAIAKAEGRP